jgi:tRNA (cmo5U34)-methyltransferase
MDRDEIFREHSNEIGDFNFGEKTAAVFDDMLDRSIPQYHELQRMIGELAAEFAVADTNIYDLGCSTGITLQSVQDAVKADVKLVGIDYSQPMLDKAKERFSALPNAKPITLLLGDLNRPMSIQNASVVLLNLTLQFVRPLYRQALIRNIYDGLNDGGCLILVEKVLGNDSLFNRAFIKLYYEMKKRNGYSETEIAKKREALENVLIPYRVDENYELLERGGFSHVDLFFKWYNFCGFIGAKLT